MYANQKRLTPRDLEGYARDLGLDVARFQADLESPETADRIARDRKLADALNVQATPTLFINGREFDLRQDLQEWVGLEIGAGAGGRSTTSGAALVPEAEKR
jgi:protein-disulfide isomerase